MLNRGRCWAQGANHCQHRWTAAFLRAQAHRTNSHRNLKTGIFLSSFFLRPTSTSTTMFHKNPLPPIGQILRPRSKKPTKTQNTTNKAKGRKSLHLKTRSKIKLEDLYSSIYIPYIQTHLPGRSWSGLESSHTHHKDIRSHG